MLLGLECPTNLLSIINPLGDFDWVSADQLLEDETYATYYRGSKRTAYLSTRKMFTLTSVTLDEIKKALYILGKDCYVVGPDTFGDMERTLKLYDGLVKELGESKVLPVVQGRNLDEALECVEKYGEFVALPFDVASTLYASYYKKMDSRYKLVNSLPNKKIHLLGITSLVELPRYRYLPNVVSINTGLPVRLGLKGESIMEYGREKRRDSRQYMNMKYSPCREEQLFLIKENIKIVREALGGKII